MTFYIEITVPCTYLDNLFNVDVIVGFSNENDFLITMNEKSFKNIEDDVEKFILLEFKELTISGPIELKSEIGYDDTGYMYADIAVSTIYDYRYN